MSKEIRNLMETRFCKFCGAKLEKERKICPKCGKLVIPIKISRYLLSDSQLKIFKQRVFPSILISFAIWMITGLYFSGLFSGTSIKFDSNIYILLIILNTILYFMIYYISLRRKMIVSLIMLLLLSFMNGIIFSLFLIWAISKTSKAVVNCFYIPAICLGTLGTVAGFSRGRFREMGSGARFYGPLDFWLHVILFGFGIVFMYLIALFFLESFIRTNLFILYVILIIIYWGIVIQLDNWAMSTHLKKDLWVFWALNIFIDLIIIIAFSFLLLFW